MSSPRFSLNNQQLWDAGSVFLWVVASAIVSFAISVLPGIELPVEWQFLVPFVNAVLYAAKKFLEDKNGRIF